MEKGAKTILLLLAVSAALGLVVIAANPDYRKTLSAWLSGKPQESPIWKSNEAYYDAIDIDGGPSEGAPRAD